MSKLTIQQNGQIYTLDFDGAHPLHALLVQAGAEISRPCGGNGRCGKCAVTVEGDISAPTEAERQAGTRLSCQTTVYGDATVLLPDRYVWETIETTVAADFNHLCPMSGRFGAAVDIGTTTVALRLYDLSNGECVGEAAARNPQATVAADVMGRIDAALNGALATQQAQITTCISNLLAQATEKAHVDSVDALVFTGNTTMLYLLTGRAPDCLARAPFEADTLFDTAWAFAGIPAYVPPCMSAFVGADMVCAVLASGMCDQPQTALLCDIGTNGEMALWKDGVLYVTSTAAGPAFEGAGISCGCGSVRGAIDSVSAKDGNVKIHTIDDAKAVGICGSGLLDAIAVGIDSGIIDETGALEGGEWMLADAVVLQPQDIRAVQLAKAAIAAGMATLLEEAHTTADDVTTLYIAGGFGSHLNVESAVAIGLIPTQLRDRTRVLGNAALSGAVQTLLNVPYTETMRRIVSACKVVNLGGNPRFNALYVDHMLFES